MFRMVEKWEASGLNQKAFCRTEGLNYFTFKYWKGKRDPKAVNLTTHPKGSRTGFIPIQVSNPIPQKENTHLGTFEIKINYPNGVQVTCPSGVGFDQVKTLIQIY